MGCWAETPTAAFCPQTCQRPVVGLGDLPHLSTWYHPDGRLMFSLHFQPQTCIIFSDDLHHLFSGADLHGEERQKQFLVSKPKCEVSDCGKWKGLWAHVWAKGRAGRFGMNWKEIARGRSPLQAVGSCLVSAFCAIYGVLWRLHCLCQMGFSVFPCWKCRFVFWSKAGNPCAEEPRCESREQSLPGSMPCSMFG